MPSTGLLDDVKRQLKLASTERVIQLAHAALDELQERLVLGERTTLRGIVE